MAVNRSRILVAQMARVYLAPVGTAAPADPVVAPASDWVEVGLFTPDSLAFNTDLNFEEVTSHQSDYPTRRMQTSASATIEVDLQEFSAANLKAVYGGGTVTTVTGPPAYYKYSPPAVGGRTQTAAMIEVIDGSKHYRILVPIAEQNDGVELKLEKASEGTLPLRLAVVGSDVGDPWQILTDDPSFAAA
ncbi:phage tail tube protein [Actinomadura violacea]|uniref:Phage tail protein n=1 Tax=Actinomadura violacea TaxID=2819934 RepID=A0ABS3RY30_9ACTN|nr:hypothetical protein [Actinomadura violacea]MBO2461668.1 hypothetical protein [Actinomadura violacea]